jgi:hypothetical protein
MVYPEELDIDSEDIKEASRIQKSMFRQQSTLNLIKQLGLFEVMSLDQLEKTDLGKFFDEELEMKNLAMMLAEFKDKIITIGGVEEEETTTTEEGGGGEEEDEFGDLGMGDMNLGGEENEEGEEPTEEEEVPTEEEAGSETTPETPEGESFVLNDQIKINNIISTETIHPVKLNPAQDLMNRILKTRIRYGYWDMHTHKQIVDRDPLFFNDEYIEKHCYVLKPHEVWKYQISICWDMALMVYSELKNHVQDIQIPYALWSRKIKNDLTEYVTHTPVIYQYNNRWYWFEYSAFKFRGIRGPFNFEYKDVVDMIFKKIMKVNQQTLLGINYNIPVEKLLNMKKITQSQFFKLCQPKNMK